MCMNRSISDNIEYIRKKCNLTQLEMASNLRISNMSYYKRLHNSKMWTLSDIKAIIELGKSLDPNMTFEDIFTEE